jgi:hypothetical protein
MIITFRVHGQLICIFPFRNKISVLVAAAAMARCFKLIRLAIGFYMIGIIFIAPMMAEVFAQLACYVTEHRIVFTHLVEKKVTTTPAFSMMVS